MDKSQKSKKKLKKSQKSVQQINREEALKSDSQYKRLFQDPIFRRVPKAVRKVEIDKRFQSMFHDKNFKLKSSVDKRGRPIGLNTNEDLRQYYNIVEEDKEDEALETNKTRKHPSKEDKSNSSSEVSDSEVEGNLRESDVAIVGTQLPEGIKEKLRDNTVDYARGDGILLEESSDDSTTEDEEENVVTVHAWGELDHDAERTNDSTCRLALCNMDWDRLKAVDLMVLFHSFLPTRGILKSVKIYMSEYGKTRLADEDVHGPQELRVEKNKHSEEEEDEDSNNNSEGEEGDGYQMEKLRKYQLNRLKYYYAVLDFDSIPTAEKIYSDCDGMEYESSATRIDLRFIPEDMQFDEEPTDLCTSLPQSDKYKARLFTTTALQQAKVRLTWDETDPLRQELTQKIHNPKEKVEDDDIKAYLASSGSEEEDEVENIGEVHEAVSDVDPVAKYRNLLESIEVQEKKKKQKDVSMEVTWGVGLKEKTESLVKKKHEEAKESSLTPWEEILEKKKERRKQKRELKKANATIEQNENPDDEVDEISDDDVDVDMNDPFFKEELESNEIMKSRTKSRRRNLIKEGLEETNEQNNAELELLLMDEEDNKHHFSLKKILQNEEQGKGKKKKLKKRNKAKASSSKTEDTFQVDLEDSRFGALFSSSEFNVDPSDPNFKKTKGMEAIIQEKHKRRITEVDSKGKGLQSIKEQDQVIKKSKRTELTSLVKSVRRNTELFQSKTSKK